MKLSTAGTSREVCGSSARADVGSITRKADASLGCSEQACNVWRPPGTTVVARGALLLLRGYKLLISSYFAGSCRFLPSCSDYAREAVVRHGALHGIWLAVRRLARCHPFCAGGHDPVPLGKGGKVGRGANLHRGHSPENGF